MLLLLGESHWYAELAREVPLRTGHVDQLDADCSCLQVRSIHAPFEHHPETTDIGLRMCFRPSMEPGPEDPS